MKILEYDYPVQKQDTWGITDATKLNCYLTCPRKYFYNYILGWVPEYANIHLVFGSAWHLAMEHLLLNGHTAQSVVDAYNKFEEYYRRYFPESMDEVNTPKIPSRAFAALLDYIETYRHDTFETLYTEIAGTVYMGHNIFEEDRFLHFRQDSIIRTDEGIKSREHKTGSTLSRVWRDQWQLSIQTGVYNHVLYCYFGDDPDERVAGVEINGAIFNKTKTQFERVPVYRSPENMRNWFWTVNNCMDLMDADFLKLSKCNHTDVIMTAFSMNPESCTKYFGCEYHDFCMAWSNPLQHCDITPLGLTTSHWNPMAEPAKINMEIS